MSDKKYVEKYDDGTVTLFGEGFLFPVLWGSFLALFLFLTIEIYFALKGVPLLIIIVLVGLYSVGFVGFLYITPIWLRYYKEYPVILNAVILLNVVVGYGVAYFFPSFI